MCGGLWERSWWFQSISWLMDRCLKCSQQSPQLAYQSVSDRPRTVKCSGSKMQSLKTAITQPYLNQHPHKNGAYEKTHLYLWKYIPAITNPHSQSLPYFQSESVTCHLPATTSCSPDVDFPHGTHRMPIHPCLCLGMTSLWDRVWGPVWQELSTPPSPRTRAVLLPALQTATTAQCSIGSILPSTTI